MKSGMYMIANMKTWDIYVGSSVDIPRRFKRHIRELRKGTHFNPRLQKSYNVYGESAFNFVIAKECSEKEARVCEQKFLTEFCGKDFCWNVAKVVNEPNTGRKLSEEHKRRIGSSNTGKLKGRTLSEETKQKIGAESKTRVRKPFSNAAKEKMRQAKIGKPAPWNSHPKGSEWGRRTVEARWVKEGKRA